MTHRPQQQNLKQQRDYSLTTNMTITCVSLRASNTGMILSVSTVVNTCHCHQDEQTLPGVAASNFLPDFIHSRYAPWIVKHTAMAISQPRTEKRRMTRPFADKAISCQPFGPWVRLSYCVLLNLTLRLVHKRATVHTWIQDTNCIPGDPTVSLQAHHLIVV